MRILVVEDDIDILNFLATELAEKYEVLQAGDGDTGWKLAKENFPDLILSDVMMPGLNGNEFCEKVKNTLFYEGELQKLQMELVKYAKRDLR